MKPLSISFTSTILTLSLIAFFAGKTAAQEEGNLSTSKRMIPIESAFVDSYRDIQVPARLKGFLAKVYFEEGDIVEEGTTIAELDTRGINGELEAAQIRFENAKLTADDDSAVAFATASKNLAQQEYNTESRIFEKGAGTRQELERLKLAWIQASLQETRSKEQKKIDAGAVRIEEQSIKAVEMLKSLHEIKAQFSGQVMAIERKEGEFVQEGQTVLRLVDLSKLRVEGKINSDDANPSDVKGQKVFVKLQQAHGEEAMLEGFVKNIALDFQAARGGTSAFVIQVIVENRKVNDQWLLHPGATVSMEVELEEK